MDAERFSGWTGGRLVELAEDECRDLLAQSEVGRLAWCGPDGPELLPINYVLHQGRLWLRSTPYSLLALTHPRDRVVFEVDDTDVYTHSGWSVVVKGTPHWHAPDEVPAGMPDLAPWPAGVRALIVSIEVRELSGRRLMPS